MNENQQPLIIPTEPKGTDVFLPKKKNNSLFFITLIILAGVAFFIGLTAFSSIFGYVYAYIFAFFLALTSWDPIIVSLIIAGMAWFIAAVLYVLGSRGNDLADKLDSMSQFVLNTKPTEYVEMDLVPTELLVQEMIERGCKADIIDDKLNVNCTEVPLTKEMKSVISGNANKITTRRQGILIAMVVALGVAIGLIIYGGLITGLWAGLVIVIYVAGVTLILIQFKVIRIWHSIIIWILMNVLLIFLGIDWFIIWISFGLLAGWTILLAVFYFLLESSCYQKDKWWCEFMRGAEREQARACATDDDWL